MSYEHIIWKIYVRLNIYSYTSQKFCFSLFNFLFSYTFSKIKIKEEEPEKVTKGFNYG